jgi:hypothetical protein
MMHLSTERSERHDRVYLMLHLCSQHLRDVRNFKHWIMASLVSKFSDLNFGEHIYVQ